MPIREDIHGPDGKLQRRKEVYRARDGTARYRECEAGDMSEPVLDREATAMEKRALVADERAARQERVREHAEGALGTLRTIRDTKGDLTPTQLSNAVRFMARVLIGLVRLTLRRFEATD